MSNWPSQSLDSVAEVVGRGITPKYSEGEGIPVINQKCIRDGRLNFDLARFHDLEKRKVREDKYLKEGDVLVNSTGVGTLGRTAPVRVLPNKATADSHVTIVRPNTEVNPGWLGYALSFAEPWIEDMAQGSTGQTELSRHELATLSLTVPPKDKQAEIAKVLELFDDKIESNQRKISILADLIDTFAVHWSTGVELCRLGDLGVQSKVSVKPQKLGNSLVDHLSIPACDDQEIPERTEALTIKSNKLSVSERAVLVSRLNPRTYRSWFFTPDPQIPAMASTEFLVLQPLSGNDEDFAALWLAIRNPEFKEEMARRVTGTSGSHQRVRPNDALEIMVPNYTYLSNDEKERVMGMLERKERLGRENTSLAALRDSLLPELLSGRLAPEVIPALINSGEVAHA